MKSIINIIVTLLSALAAGLLLTSAYGGFIDPRSFYWPAILNLGFPIAFVTSIVVAVLCLMLRFKRAAAVVALALLLSLPAWHSFMPLSWGGTPDNPDKAFTVLTWNVIGFEPMNDDYGPTMQHVLDVDADVVLMQETSLNDDDYLNIPYIQPLKKELEQRYPYRTTGANDLVIMSKVPFKLMPDTTMRNRKGLNGPGSFHTYGKVYDINIKGHDLRVINLHLQSIGLSAEDKQLYKDIATFNEKVNTTSELKQVKHSLTDKLGASYQRRAGEAQAVRDIIDASPEAVVVCGDFNDTPGSYSYRTIRGDDMNDAFIDCCALPVNTFNASGMYFKIDHMFYRGNLRAVDSRVDKAGSSDHYPVVTTFEWK